MMILLCEVAIKSEGTRFPYFGQYNNYRGVIIFNNCFPYQKT